MCLKWFQWCLSCWLNQLKNSLDPDLMPYLGNLSITSNFLKWLFHFYNHQHLRASSPANQTARGQKKNVSACLKKLLVRGILHTCTHTHTSCVCVFVGMIETQHTQRHTPQLWLPQKGLLSVATFINKDIVLQTQCKKQNTYWMYSRQLITAE